MIENGSHVKFHYTLTVDEQALESSFGREPLEYVHGEGQIVPGLESQLEGLNAGDKKDVTVPPEQAYGAQDPSAFQKVPKQAFGNPDDIHVGDRVAGQRDGGQSFQARVAEVGNDDVTLDLNHPLAGKTLHFAIEVVDVR